MVDLCKTAKERKNKNSEKQRQNTWTHCIEYDKWSMPYLIPFEK